MSGSKIVIYHYRANGKPVVCKGLATATEKELEQILASNPGLQATRKPLGRGVKGVTIYQHDLLTEAQKSERDKYPNYDANIAAVELTFDVWLSNMVTRKYPTLVILSPKT